MPWNGRKGYPPHRPDDVLVKVKACGLCYTDVKIIKGEDPPPIVILPHYMGHEAAGEIAAVALKSRTSRSAIQVSSIFSKPVMSVLNALAAAKSVRQI
jgi:D-arabinose 1-dehydrogenase-like Zn-dependent alcohol dehydrogenase